MNCNSHPRSITSLLLLALCLATACSFTSSREFETVPMSKGQLWRGISEVANSGGWPSDPAFTDEGLGIYQSRWRTRVLRLGHAGRTRLHVEMEPSPDPGRGWIVSYYVEQQLVDDPRVSFDPAESDWEDDGQDAQQEEIFAARLRIRLGMDMEMNADGAFR